MASQNVQAGPRLERRGIRILGLPMATARQGTRGRRRVARVRQEVPTSAAARLAAAEALFRDFCELTPFAYRPFTRGFDSWDDYERWRRAQANPWYR